MLHPCRDCAEKGRCDMEAEKSKAAFFAWAHGLLVYCGLRTEKTFRGIDGVAA